jgi:hypothetical protein
MHAPQRGVNEAQYAHNNKHHQRAHISNIPTPICVRARERYRPELLIDPFPSRSIDSNMALARATSRTSKRSRPPLALALPPIPPTLTFELVRLSIARVSPTPLDTLPRSLLTLRELRSLVPPVRGSEGRAEADDEEDDDEEEGEEGESSGRLSGRLERGTWPPCSTHTRPRAHTRERHTTQSERERDAHSVLLCAVFAR